MDILYSCLDVWVEEPGLLLYKDLKAIKHTVE